MDFVIFVVNFLFSILYIVLALRAVLPWISHSWLAPFRLVVNQLTEPVLSPIRLGLPPLRIGMDVSPFIVIILIWILHQLILRVLS